VTSTRKVIVHIAASVDGYIARANGEMEWLTSRPKPEGFYGMGDFMRTIDTKVLGRKTYEEAVKLGATFDSKDGKTIVFSHRAPPEGARRSIEFVNEAIGSFVRRLKAQPGKDIWLMGGGEIIAAFLDAKAIDEFVISMVPVFIGDGIPLIARKHRHVQLELVSTQKFDDGLVQLRYRVINRSTSESLP
jgi:dihydrofolate reductase